MKKKYYLFWENWKQILEMEMESEYYKCKWKIYVYNRRYNNQIIKYRGIYFTAMINSVKVLKIEEEGEKTIKDYWKGSNFKKLNFLRITSRKRNVEKIQSRVDEIPIDMQDTDEGVLSKLNTLILII